MASRRTPSESSSSSKSRTKPAATPEPVTVPPAVTAAEAPKTPARKAAPRAKRTVAARPTVTPDMRRGMIAESAYLRAERRGFAPGHEDEDWLAAEAEVDQLLSADRRTPQ